MLMRRLILLLVFLSSFVLPTLAGNRPKTESTSQILSQIAGYKGWKQVNRFDGEPSARSFMIERSWAGG